MTEIARSIDTGLPTLAYDVWLASTNANDINIYSGSKMFVCLDDENCGIQMTLVNWSNHSPKRAAYFKQSSNTHNPHDANCRMEYGTVDDRNELLSLMTGLSSQLDLQETVENTISLSQATRSDEKDPDNVNNTVSVEKDELWQNQQVQNYDKQRNRIGLSKAKIQRLRGFYLWMNEHPSGIVTAMDWPAYDFNDNERPSFIKPLRAHKPTKISDILIDLDKTTNIPTNQVKVYSGHLVVILSNNTYKLTSLANPELEISIKENQLKYIMNHSELINVANTQSPVKIILCGHFYVNKHKKLQFLRRTKYSGDWISVV
ncbi:hypothetical protein KIJ00_03140 [Leuconostoc gelidum subsp. aenigmaticum]|uniref:hypothetical protein n=1 Tax=Leuconostoc gelidum TaxID=1244 RepID=UPI001CC76065|nr:hypothetical protein [Leuconostoc gelidum]MBZ6008258.1 hypothetical protein [Leuconostoc gelidum subsp. aenigmaticum]